MKFLPSPSKLDLFETCSFPWTGPIRWPGYQDGDQSLFGKAVHKAADLMAKEQLVDLDAIAKEFSLEGTDIDRLTQSVDHVAEILGKDGYESRISEVLVAYDPQRETARILKEGQRKEQWEQRGAIDLVTFHSDAYCTVRDWKTGRRALNKPAEELRQIQWYAVVVALLYPVERIRVDLAHVGEDTWSIDGAEFSYSDLCDLRAGLKLMLEEGAKKSLPVYGSHCSNSYCPIITECPAVKATAAMVKGASEMKQEWSAVIKDDSHCGEMFVRAAMVKSAAEEVLKNCRAWVKDKKRPVELPDGKLLAEVVRVGNDVVQATPEFMAFIAEKFGTEAANEVVTTKITKKALFDQVDKIVPKGKREPAKRALIEQGRRFGAVKQGSAYKSVEVCSRGKDAQEEVA